MQYPPRGPSAIVDLSCVGAGSLCEPGWDANLGIAATMSAPIDRLIALSQVAATTAGGETLRNRWGILAVLFAVRATMAFQFQSVAAVAPLLSSEFGASLADIGALIGLYFAPGVALALPGGAIGQKFGDKTAVLGALLSMLIGSLAMAMATSWSVQITGRLVAGAGGVVLSVQLTKMLTDWFAGREIATAMAILVNSWPAGIAVSLLTLPVIGSRWGVSAVYLAVAAFVVCGIALIALLYRPPAQ